METRRTRRIKQRDARQTVVVIVSMAVLGLAVGLALPRSRTAAVLLLVVALVSIAAAMWNASLVQRLRDRVRANVSWAAGTVRSAVQRAFSSSSLDEFDAEMSRADAEWSWSDAEWSELTDDSESVHGAA